MKNQKPLSQKLYELRTEHKLSKRALAKALNISRSTVYAMEGAVNKPSYNTISKICRFYNIDTKELLDM